MPSFFLNFNVLRSQAQLKVWSNRPDVPLGSSSSRWRKKNSKPSSSKPSPPPSPTTTTTTATASSSSRSPTERSSSIKPSTSSTPTTASSIGSVSWTGSTTNVLLIHPLCRCCTDVVNSITRPIRRAPKVTATTTTTNSSSGGSSSTTATTGTTTTAPGSTGRKPTWDGFPSTQYMRLWPQPDEEKLWEAKFRPERSRLAAPALPDPPKKKQTKKQRSWKFWPTSIL